MKKHAVLCRTLLIVLSLTVSFSHFIFPSCAEESSVPSATVAEEGSLNLNCKSAVLMDAATGTVLYAQNADEALPPASVTKIMTLLLVMEAIDAGTLRLDDPISVSATAASMGGSQVYLEEGETMSCEDMLKSVIISSANDAAVALAEHIAGDLDTFVKRMNEKAAALGMTATAFENATGLDDTTERHLTSARDIAIMSRALIAHDTILKYSSIWMDTIRGGTFGLTNTNRLVRFYRGATGLKTGSTEKAGFCVSVTASRDSLSLICVIMGAESRDIRNAQATKLLDWGFANYAVYQSENLPLEAIRITGGVLSTCPVRSEIFSYVLPKSSLSAVEYTIEMRDKVSAPIQSGTEVGTVIYRIGEQEIGRAPVVTAQSIARVGYWQLFSRLLAAILLK